MVRVRPVLAVVLLALGLPQNEGLLGGDDVPAAAVLNYMLRVYVIALGTQGQLEILAGAVKTIE